MQDHRAFALEHASMWAAYAMENGTAVTSDQVVAAARQFAAFLSEPTDVHVVIDQPAEKPGCVQCGQPLAQHVQPDGSLSCRPTLKPTRKRA